MEGYFRGGGQRKYEMVTTSLSAISFSEMCIIRIRQLMVNYSRANRNGLICRVREEVLCTGVGCRNTSISPVFFQPLRIFRYFRWWLNDDYVLQFATEMNVHARAKRFIVTTFPRSFYDEKLKNHREYVQSERITSILGPAYEFLAFQADFVFVVTSKKVLKKRTKMVIL